ncbi:tripartite motif-containing protein 43-like [Perognathus longimembris pacificus]|uniref:tripartite motif-containing protein 43-like n=1 Tax=Perognathus longimembris pacificus TaxID=214514 RepID=UPI00201909E6|nr:tripartite motif-containing protein 43-like [Perognathus longimembris pacificus]
MDMDITQAFQEGMSCVICLNTLIDPVTIVCGHTFCRPCLCLAWEKAQNPARCPVCRAPSKRRNLKTNIKMKNLVSIARKASLQQFLSSEEHRCETHQEPKQMFCEVETKLLCKLCSRSSEHQAHRHSPIEEAAEAHREMILKQMTSLWDKIQENQRKIHQEIVLIKEWVCYMQEYRRSSKNMFEILLPQLQEEAKKHSERLIKENRVTLQQLKARKRQMFNKKTHLRKMYQELMKTYQNPDVKLLMDWKYTRARCESLLVYMPQPMNPKLRALPISGLMDELNQHRVEISFSQETQKAGMRLFDNVRIVIEDSVDAFFNSDRSNFSTAWGVQTFSSGKHYWELTVDDSLDWALGVCRSSRKRKKPMVIHSGDIFLLLCVKGKKDTCLFTTCPFLPHYIERPVGRIGVFLNFEDGSLSFVNVAKGSIIWKYDTGSFQIPVRPFFSTERST